MGDLNNDFTHGLVAFKILMSFNDIIPLEHFVNENLEFSITFGEMFQHSVIINFTSQLVLIFNCTCTKIGATNLQMEISFH